MPSSTAKTEKPANGSRATDPSISEMEAQIETLKAEIAKLTAQVQSSGEKSLEALKSIAQEGATQMRAKGEAAVQGLKSEASDIEGEIVARVREKPVTSLAIAAGVGFLFALLTRR
ncbi:DUF883 family protein [Mesorhizobium australicum]|uniref:Membrane-anchored ribosome-binding protein, inhibits growth in stationary phase, ElaB/YqjD/DUF883 family n=1 Tax=Mesorhizobium australicum TaxID=536018 RepID=A0A1X7PZA8_9HYPH|nr:DUF883 family protein [Mesorhizobium australicum]SMH57058.1 Membrane-anchored ribosome-binding protein, inhibits growth in stationary phase, ElaB/YqjD/DUF883 family [Mesorhizobium australicum]